MTTAWPETLDLRCGPVRAIDLALHAAASGDHNFLHLDETVAAAAGFERPVVHGMLTMAYAGRLFTSHFRAGAVRRLQMRFTGVAMRGDVIDLQARLEGVAPIGGQYAVQVTTQDGRVIATGSALVAPEPGE